jgi:hypothetical protein
MRLRRRQPTSTPGGDRLAEARLLDERDAIVAEAARHFEANRVEEGAKTLARLTTVDEVTLTATDPFLRAVAGGRRIVATTDPARRPAEDEIVVVYGNFPHSFDNVVVNNPIRRHVAGFGDLAHDVVESDPRWAGIACIVVINADHRPDRYDGVMRELATARAPLDRVVRLPAVFERPTRESLTNGRIGLVKSHRAALALAAPRPGEHALILEDDFCFTSDLETHLDDLASFVERSYDYTVCLLATSKYGLIEPRDDLVAESHQPCTNSSAYLVAGDHAERLDALIGDALAGLIETHDERYVLDRYWRVLQPDGRLLVFRRKMGFQAASFSDIEARVSRYLD